MEGGSRGHDYKALWVRGRRVPLGGRRRVGGLLGVAGRLSETVSPFTFLFHHVTKNQITILWLPITLMSETLHFLVTVSFLITKPYHPKAPELFHCDSEQEARMASPAP